MSAWKAKGSMRKGVLRDWLRSGRLAHVGGPKWLDTVVKIEAEVWKAATGPRVTLPISSPGTSDPGSAGLPCERNAGSKGTVDTSKEARLPPHPDHHTEGAQKLEVKIDSVNQSRLFCLGIRQ
jgi:hypothetical protein